MTTPGCLALIVTGGLQIWLFLWAIWEHPQFWFIVAFYYLLAIVNAITNVALKKE